MEEVSIVRDLRIIQIITITTTITIYFINPSGKLKLSFDRTMKNISQIMNHTHMHTLIHTPHFSQSAYTNSIIANPNYTVSTSSLTMEVKAVT